MASTILRNKRKEKKKKKTQKTDSKLVQIFMISNFYRVTFKKVSYSFLIMLATTQYIIYLHIYESERKRQSILLKNKFLFKYL